MHDDGPEGGMVLLARAPNAAMAGLWASMLEAAGIQAHVPGTFLADEWAATQRIVGGVGSDVFVPRDRLEEARRVIAQEPITTEGDEDAAARETSGEVATGAVAPVTSSSVASSATPRASRRSILFELAAVCGVIVFPAYFSVMWGLAVRSLRPWDWKWDLADGVHVLAYDIPLIVFLRWVISRTGEPASAFGWVRVRPLRDLLLGAGVLVLLVLATSLMGNLMVPDAAPSTASNVEKFVRGAPKHGGALPLGWLEWLIYIASTVTIAFLEELSMRGYLMMRLRQLPSSATAAAVVASAVWAGFHLYQGLVPVAVHFIQGLLLSWVFFKLERLWPLVIAHAGFDALLPWVPIWLKQLE